MGNSRRSFVKKVTIGTAGISMGGISLGLGFTIMAKSNVNSFIKGDGILSWFPYFKGSIHCNQLIIKERPQCTVPV